MTSIEYFLFGAAVLLLLSVFVSKASSRFGIPALLVFLVIGMLAGSEGPGGIYFDNAQIAQSIGVVALVLILYSGGLETDWQRVRPVLSSAFVLATLGVGISALLVGWFATVVLNFSLLEGVLLGAIVSSTDAAAVFAVLRTRGVRLRSRIEPLLEFESGSNDPMAVLLTVGLIRMITEPSVSLPEMLLSFVLQMVLGGLAGYVMGHAITWMINRVRLQVEGLYPVLSVALALFTYGATALIGGNGFLAVYLAAVVAGNSDLVHRRSIHRFHDGLAWLMQIAMFLALGLLVFPSRLLPVIGAGLLVAVFLMFVARPISVFIGLLFSKMHFNEKAMVAWVGLRGAVPIILATFPLLAGVPRAETMFNIVFFIVLTSVLLQGTSLPLVARWLKADAPSQAPERPPQGFVPQVDTASEVIELVVPPQSPLANRSIVELALPHGALIILIKRDDERIVPNGGTVLHAGDTLLMLVDRAALADIQSLVDLPQSLESSTANA